MAPPVPSCISNTFCAHRQASWFLIATLSPFFLPFLILCTPFLLLFLAPVSVFLFSLLFSYKVRGFLCPKFKRSRKHADKRVVNEGYQPAHQVEAVERVDFHRQTPSKDDREFKELDSPNVQSAEPYLQHKGGDEMGLCIPRSRVSQFEEENLGLLEEDLAAQHHETEEKQEEQDIVEDSFVQDEDEGPEVSHVQNVELPVSSKAQVEEGLQIPRSESKCTEETQEDMGEALLLNDRMEDYKQNENEATQESIVLKDEQKHSPRHLAEERRRLMYKSESMSLPVEEQGQESLEDRSERLESLHKHPAKEAWSDLPAIQVTEPIVHQLETSVFPDQIAEKPGEEELYGHSEIDTTPCKDSVTHQHIRRELEPSSMIDSRLEILDNQRWPDEKEDIIFPTEPFEKETEEGERSYSLPEGDGQCRRESFPMEASEKQQSQTGVPAKNLAAGLEAETSSEREEGYPSETTSSEIPLSHADVESQDRIREEQKILADIDAIKKIVGYQSEPHASILEQISALYLFLGMEPYDWAAEMDSLERAQAEIELLKVVVGVK